MDRRVLRVVLASPGDVTSERDLTAKVFEEINRGIGRANNVLFELWRWETDAHPQFHPEGAQGAIDRTLKIADCDLLIGIFWKRFGTPLKGAASGTEHEIRLAHAAWKAKGRLQVMLYLSQQPYTPRSREELEQWGKVLDFKAEFQGEGLLWPYEDPQRFEALLRRHVTDFLIEACKPDEPASPSGALDADADALLRALAAATRQDAPLLSADRVNEVGARLGLSAGAVLSIVERLRRAGAVQLHWGGGVSVAPPGRNPRD